MKLLATFGAFLFSGIVAATPIHNMVIFGDSLSDNGNLYEYMKHQLPQSPPYFKGRFSNGPVWIERLISYYFPSSPSSHLLDYAFGGAGVSEEEGDDALFTLKREVENYLVSHQNKASEDSLFVVWVGANNYLGMPEEVEKTLNSVNAGITHSLQRLVEKGAKHIMVMNLPDLGRTPAAIEFNSVEMLTYFANQHNEALNKSFNSLKQMYPDVNWLYFDLNQMFTHVLENPQEYGITNIIDTCYNSGNDESVKKSVLQIVANVQPTANQEDCAGYLFFDLVHPTALAHKIIAEKIRIMFDSSGVEFAD